MIDIPSFIKYLKTSLNREVDTYTTTVLMGCKDIEDEAKARGKREAYLHVVEELDNLFNDFLEKESI
jgi:hypothetical protein